MPIWTILDGSLKALEGSWRGTGGSWVGSKLECGEGLRGVLGGVLGGSWRGLGGVLGSNN